VVVPAKIVATNQRDLTIFDKINEITFLKLNSKFVAAKFLQKIVAGYQHYNFNKDQCDTKKIIFGQLLYPLMKRINHNDEDQITCMYIPSPGINRSTCSEMLRLNIQSN